MRSKLGILLSTASIGLGAIAATTPAAANPAIILPLAAAAAGGLAVGGAIANGPYPYQGEGSDRWMGQTQVAPPAGYSAEAYPPTYYGYPNTVYEPAPYAYNVYGPAYGGSCHIQIERVPDGSNAVWRNFTVCD